jgi:hypothetical protein
VVFDTFSEFAKTLAKGAHTSTKDFQSVCIWPTPGRQIENYAVVGDKSPL